MRAEGGFEQFERALVAGGHGREKLRRVLRDHRDEVTLGRRFDRDIEQRHRQRSELRRGTRSKRRARGVKDGGAVGEMRFGEFGFELLEQPRNRGAGAVECGKLHRANAVQPQLHYGSRQCTGESRTVENRGEMRKRTGRREVGDGARRHRLDGETRGGREAAGCQAFGGKQSGKTSEREPMDARNGAAAERETAHQVVGGIARRRDHQRLGGRLQRGKPGAGRIDAVLGAWRNNNFGGSPHQRCVSLIVRLATPG